MKTRNRNTKWFFLALAVAIAVVGIVAYCRQANLYRMLDR